jgi:phosphatidylserine decarboxylase
MVRDGYLYALGMLVAALVLWWIWPPLASIPLLLAAFFLWFFRDPDRVVPSEPGLIVSPADGKVTSIEPLPSASGPHVRISIFLNVFNVHVNRSPVGGVVREVQYQKGKFGNAISAASSDINEQNVVTVEGEGHRVQFKQIAGLLARRIVFTKAVGDTLRRGERVGLIKFGSRVDVIVDSSAEVIVKLGDHVAGGSSILARFRESVGVRNEMSRPYVAKVERPR